MGRVHIHSCDFALGNYTYVTDYDTELTSFDIAHDHEWVLPLIKDATKFIEAYGKEGVPIWAVSVQNEPAAVQVWDSCIYSAEEERDFVKNHLGPVMHQTGHSDVNIVIWDHNRDCTRSGTDRT